MLEQCARRGVSVLAIFDKHYPQRLRAVHDPPPVIYCHGSVDALGTPRSVAVVGTREPTKFGCSATEEITEALAGAGWAVISGLAKGIDSIAHGAALKYHTPTVAVMAGGLDHIYPAQNKELAAAIVEQGGALVSEQRWGARPQRSSFVQRNRIQTGLAAAVIVAQTGTVGGTMHTVRYAAAQGRPVFCPVPHSAHEKNEGLRVLLNLPARELCGVLPAWKDAGRLCERLGNEPLARLRVRPLMSFLTNRSWRESVAASGKRNTQRRLSRPIRIYDRRGAWRFGHARRTIRRVRNLEEHITRASSRRRSVGHCARDERTLVCAVRREDRGARIRCRSTLSDTFHLAIGIGRLLALAHRRRAGRLPRTAWAMRCGVARPTRGQ